jgi:2-oxoglutarate ferredoxin oxidoreductase subunit beta
MRNPWPVPAPCRTFRPEQAAWKHQVHPVAVEAGEDPMEAARAIHADDGRSLGIFYAASLPVWQPAGKTGGSLQQIERELEV